MKLLRIIIFTAACIFVISGVTGIQRLHLSTDTGISIARHSPMTRLISFMLALVCWLWYSGLRQRALWGIWITNSVFIGMIVFSLWMGIYDAVTEEPTSAKIWNLASQTGLAVLLFLVWRKVKRVLLS
jgi:hypothetical protein